VVASISLRKRKGRKGQEGVTGRNVREKKKVDVTSSDKTLHKTLG